jgi:hypothetical protein
MRALCLLLLLPLTAAADIVTEIGAGLKIERSTSYLLLPSCEYAVVLAPGWPENPRGTTHSYSCGGDNPAFIGWPIAWQSDFSDVWTIRAGWFHYSNWFDGGRDHETHMDAIAVTTTFNWSKWREGRRK